MNVVIFGASVSAQRYDRRTSLAAGFYLHLEERIKSLDGSINLFSVCAASSGFSDAGYALIPEVLDLDPQLIVLDWHSTFEAKFNSTLWNSAIDLFAKKGINVLICIFPQRDLIGKSKRPNVKQAVESSELYPLNVRMLDLYDEKKFTADLHLRDNVHTTPQGGEFYAELIIQKLRVLNWDVIAPQILYKCDPRDFSLAPTVCVHKNNQYQKTKIVKLSNIKTKHSCNSILFDMMIGRFSPVVRIFLNSQLISEISLWDRWCHYTRQRFISVANSLPISKSDTLEIRCTEIRPAYELCSHAQPDSFPEYDERYMSFKNIYFIGIDIQGLGLSL